MAASRLGRQRSVLVAGDGLAAASAAGFLSQAGLDPVVASASSRPADADPVVLWQPGLLLLERLGLRRPIERLGTPLDSRRSPAADRSATAESARPALLSVAADRLAELIETSVLDGVRVSERSVTALAPTETGVRATLEGAVTEPFDVVVTTDRSLLADHPRGAAPGGIHSWSLGWPAPFPAIPGPGASWTDDRAAVVTPIDDRHWLRLLSTASAPSAAALSADKLDSRFGGLIGELLPPDVDTHTAPLSEIDPHTLRYSRTPQQVPARVVEGGIVRIGAAARCAVPGDYLGPTLGIEDAWVLADAVAYGPDEIEAALGDYERRRRARERDISAFVTEEMAADGLSAGRSSSLERLRVRRGVAFGHARDDGGPDLGDSIPQRL